MSWLFGLNKGQQPPQNPYLPEAPPSDGGTVGDVPKDIGGVSGNEGRDSKMEAYRFDSGALERAAKAAKELEKSCKNMFVIINSFYDFRRVARIWQGLYLLVLLDFIGRTKEFSACSDLDV